MSVYVANLFFVLGYSFLDSKYSSYNINTPETEKRKTVFFYIVLLTLVLISGLRYMDYYLSDEWVYRIKYGIIGNDSFINIIKSSEFGFNMLNWILYKISKNPQTIIFVCSLITNIYLVSTIKRYSSIFWISMYMYICMGVYDTSFNIIRQFLAIAIVYGGIKYLVKRQFKKYLIMVLIATTIHTSAVIMIPIYFISNKKVSIKTALKIVTIAIIAIIIFEPVVNLISSVIGGINPRIDQYLSAITTGSGYGVNPLRVVVYICPLVIAFINKGAIEVKNKNIDLFLNLYLIGSMIMIVSLKFVYIARFAEYFTIALLILIPDILTSFKNKNINIIVCFISSILYFIYFIYLMSIGSDYRSIFTTITLIK